MNVTVKNITWKLGFKFTVTPVTGKFNFKFKLKLNGVNLNLMPVNQLEV